MSNEIKNTLFRFVSMRAPELTSDFENNPGFIIADNDNIKGSFLDAVNQITSNGSKREALQTAATSFAPNVLKTENIKNLNTGFYEFSVWLSKNRFKATEEEIKIKVILLIEINID